jgi:hypothetical protein
MLEAVVERADLLAGRRKLFVEKALTASMIGFSGGCLRHERTGPMGFCAGFVHPRAHLLQPAFEEKDTVGVGAALNLAGHIRRGVWQLLSLPHDRTTDGICSVVPASKLERNSFTNYTATIAARIPTLRRAAYP